MGGQAFFVLGWDPSEFGRVGSVWGEWFSPEAAHHARRKFTVGPEQEDLIFSALEQSGLLLLPFAQDVLGLWMVRLRGWGGSRCASGFASGFHVSWLKVFLVDARLPRDPASDMSLRNFNGTKEAILRQVEALMVSG